MIFGYFKVEPKFQHRVLLYGVFGAIVLRAIMIFIGAALVQQLNGFSTFSAHSCSIPAST